MASKKESPVKAGEAVDTTTGEIVPVSSIPAVDTMSADEFAAWLASENIEAVEFDGGSEWELIGDKEMLINQDMVVARIRFNEGTSGNFVSVCAYTIPDGKKVIFNDGGTGVYKHLKSYTERTGRTTAIRGKKGLKPSRYTYVDDNGVERDAVTFYIA